MLRLLPALLRFKRDQALAAAAAGVALNLGVVASSKLSGALRRPENTDPVILVDSKGVAQFQEGQ